MTGVKHINSDSEINPKTGKPYYYKDNPEAHALRNKKRMFIKGKYVAINHILQKPGNYKSFQEAAFESLPRYKLTKEGYVYILSNPAWKDWYKVGMAADVNDRYNSYQTTTPLRDFKLEHYIATNDRRVAERKIHSKLKKIANSVAGEWFNVLLSEAVQVLNEHTDETANDKEIKHQGELNFRYFSN